MLGVNAALRTHVKQMAKKNWDMQREAGAYPICDIKTKIPNSELPSYLDNKDLYTLQQNIPVLTKTVKYRDTKGKIQIDDSLYFIFISGTITMHKDDIIIHNGSTYVVESINDDINSGLLQVEGRLP
jgi:hypothetical protein